MSVELPPLPYPLDALEPHVSARTLATHHGKHHRAYVEKTRLLAGERPGALEDIIVRAAADPAQKTLFNNAAQAWNHAFFWRSLRPAGGSVPSRFARHLDELRAAAAGHFGSGWAWLVRDGAELKVMTTANADTPLVHGKVPLLVIDLWEHAYYLDHQERRAAYVDAVIDRLLNWEFAEANLKAAEK